MKKLLSLLSFIFLSFFSAYAVKAYPGLIEITQPDGTIVNGGNIVLDVDNISDINKEIIEDYITNNGDRSYTIRLDDKGALRK